MDKDEFINRGAFIKMFKKRVEVPIAKYQIGLLLKKIEQKIRRVK